MITINSLNYIHINSNLQTIYLFNFRLLRKITLYIWINVISSYSSSFGGNPKNKLCSDFTIASSLIGFLSFSNRFSRIENTLESSFESRSLKMMITASVTPCSNPNLCAIIVLVDKKNPDFSIYRSIRLKSSVLFDFSSDLIVVANFPTVFVIDESLSVFPGAVYPRITYSFSFMAKARSSFLSTLDTLGTETVSIQDATSSSEISVLLNSKMNES